MKIIAVKINITYPLLPTICATKRAWNLDLKKCKKYDYVVGVSEKQIKGVYKLIDVFKDCIDPKRVEFILCPCTPVEEFVIKNEIYKNPEKINLSFNGPTMYIDDFSL